MGKHAQKNRNSQARTADDTYTEPVEQDTSELSEDVSCCLADIDAVLDDNDAEAEILAQRRESDREAAIKEFWAGEHQDSPQVWEEKYAHLGAAIGHACCSTYPYFND